MYMLPMNYMLDDLSLGAISMAFSFTITIVALGVSLMFCNTNTKAYYIPRDIIDKYYYNLNLINNLNTELSTENKMNMALDDIITATKKKNKAEIKIKKYMQNIGKFTLTILEDKSA